jgi:hypothetical protein
MSPEAIAIRDAAYDRLSGLSTAGIPLFKYTGFVPVEKEPDDQLPSLLVIALSETFTPEGDANAGEPAFINELTLALAMAASGNSREKDDARLTLRTTAVLTTLLRDPTFLAMFEGVTRITAKRDFDTDGERFFARARVDLTIQYRTDFPPIVIDDFLAVEVEGRPVPGDGNTPAAPMKITVTPP